MNAGWLRGVTALGLLLAIFASTSTIALAGDKTASMGELIISGPSLNGEDAHAMLNGERAFSGRTFFSTSSISTTGNSTATLKLGTSGSITLAPNSSLNLSFDDKTISGTLSAGQVKVFNNEGVEVNIVTPDGTVINAESGNAAQDTNTTGNNNSPLAPLLVFGGIVGGTIIYLITKSDDDRVVSPLR